MAKKIKVTDFKTKKINQFTGGQIGVFKIPDYPENLGDGKLSNSFLAPNGSYIGDYGRAWWYVKNNMLVCFDHPIGVSIILNIPVKDYDLLDSYLVDGVVGENVIKSYYGYSHRGGNTFTIGDRLFDEKYDPIAADYSITEWSEFNQKREESILRNLASGFCETREMAEKETPISDVIPFRLRGSKLIETWNEAKQAAINLSNSLS